MRENSNNNNERLSWITLHLLLKIEQLQSKFFQASASHAATDEVKDNYFITIFGLQGLLHSGFLSVTSL